MKLFSVKDMKAQVWLKPHIVDNVAEAMRSWEIVANEGESMISKFPNDFRLYCIAEFNTISGKLEVYDDAADLGSAADVKRRPTETPTLPFSN